MALIPIGLHITVLRCGASEASNVIVSVANGFHACVQQAQLAHQRLVSAAKGFPACCPKIDDFVLQSCCRGSLVNPDFQQAPISTASAAARNELIPCILSQVLAESSLPETKNNQSLKPKNAERLH
jgi:hypothetical protein